MDVYREKTFPGADLDAELSLERKRFTSCADRGLIPINAGVRETRKSLTIRIRKIASTFERDTNPRR